MARPSKYNWEAIKIAYEGGIDESEIVKKFKVTAKHLKDKARASKWQVNSEIKNDIDEFIAKSEKLAINYQEHPEVNELVIEKINTQVLDNELIENNRKLSKMLQGVIVANRGGINLNNIKSVAGTLKDIESIANPVSSNTNVAIQNNQQSSNNVDIVGYGVKTIEN